MTEILFLIAVTASLISNFFGIPGNLLIVVNTFIYGLVTRFDNFSYMFVLLLFLIVFTLEFIEYLMIALTAKKYGATKLGAAGGIIGGLIGGISGAFFTPVIGAIIGSVLGVFLGAFTIDFIKSYKFRESVYSGFGAFLGKIGGLSIKVCGAVTMVIMIGYKIF